MAWVQKKITTVFVDSSGNRVPRETTGARKVKLKSEKWYGCWKEGTRKVMVPLATDKQASEAMLTDIIRRRERGEAELLNPFKEHLNSDIECHLTDYLSQLRDMGRSSKYLAEKSRILQLIFQTCKIRSLVDLTLERIERYLRDMTNRSGKETGKPVAASTKLLHRNAINAFGKWLKEKKRWGSNTLETAFRPDGDPVRQRRSLTPLEIQRLLDAARLRPLQQASVNRGGRLPKGTKREFSARVSPKTRAYLQKLGRERALIYKTAVTTGLRQGELAALKVAYLNLNSKPMPSFELPGEFTKNRKDAKILLIPALAEELQQWVTDAGKLKTDFIFRISDKMNKIFRRDLEAAGLPYRDELGRVADFHSLRHSVNTMLGVAGIPVKLRQLFMRHSDIRLTTATYDDSTLYEIEPVVKALEALNLI